MNLLMRKIRNKLFEKERLPLKHLIFIGILPGILKKIYYRLLGYKIGKNVYFGFFSAIIGENISIENNTKIGNFTIIKGKSITIGSHTEIDSFVYMNVPKVSIGKDVVIREQVKIGGNETHKSSFSIGDRSHIRQNVIINTSDSVIIGEETAIGGGTYIFTHSSWHSLLDGFPCSYAPVKIGNNVWISWDSFILPNVTINDDVLIGAGSVVTKNIPSNCIAMGNPAKIIIPSGQYKREIDFQDKLYFLDLIVKNYIEYMKFKGHNITLNKNEKTWEVKFNFKKRSKNIIFIFDPSFHINSKADCYVILTGKSLDYNSLLTDSHIMLIDLDFYFRFRSNDIGESFVDFLLKYGVKLKRK